MVNLIGHLSKGLLKQEDESIKAIKLNEADAVLLLEALTRSAIVNENLKAAAVRYESKAQ